MPGIFPSLQVLQTVKMHIIAIKQCPYNLLSLSYHNSHIYLLVPFLGTLHNILSQSICMYTLSNFTSFCHNTFNLLTMQRVAAQLSHRLTFVPTQNFCAITRDSVSNPIKERIMSTPSWPVPYYQRLHKAYPVREQKKVNLTLDDFNANDTNWYMAKNNLKATLKGRQIVQYTENHIATKTYLVSKEDCATMAKAYVDDVGQFLDLANRENVRILAGKTLI